MHVPAEVGGMQGDLTLEVIKEEHFDFDDSREFRNGGVAASQEEARNPQAAEEKGLYNAFNITPKNPPSKVRTIQEAGQESD